MSKPTREAILEEMRRTAALNDGKPLGMRRFHDATGISDYDWGEYWPRYSDLQREAGFDPNTWSRPPLEVQFVIEKYIALTRELGRLPTDRELRLQRNHDADFPSVKVFRRVAGSKRDLVDQVLEHCQGKPEYDDVAAICEAEPQTAESDRRYFDAPDDPPEPLLPPAHLAAERAGPVWGQLDLKFEEASRMLDERLADVVRREAALTQDELRLQQGLAQVADRRAALEKSSADLANLEQARQALDQGAAEAAHREGELAEKLAEVQRTIAEAETRLSQLEQARAGVEEAQRALDVRSAGLAEREAALARQQAELQETMAQAAAQPQTPASADDADATRRTLAERAAELAQRESTLVEVAKRVQRSLAETQAERSELEQGRSELDEAERGLEEAQRGLAARAADLEQREADLAAREQERAAAAATELASRAQPEPDPVERAELEQLRTRQQELLAQLAERERALADREYEARQALAQAQHLRAELDRAQPERLDAETARRELASLVASVAERERLVAEREANLDQALAVTGEQLDLEARAQWLTDAVKTAARQEAETVIKEAHEQAQRILARARAGQDPTALPSEPADAGSPTF